MIRPISHVLFAANYYSAWKFIPFLLISTVFNVASGFLGPILNAGYNVKAVAKSGFYGMVFNIILNIILTYLVGAQGVTIATAISSFIIYHIRKRAANEILSGNRYFIIVFVWILLIFSAIFYTYTQYVWISVLIWLLIVIAFVREIFKLMSALVVRGRKNN